MIYISRATAFVTRTHFGCVSTRRHKHDSNVGFAKRDFTSEILKKKIDAQDRFEPTQRCMMCKIVFGKEVSALTSYAIWAITQICAISVALC